MMKKINATLILSALLTLLTIGCTQCPRSEEPTDSIKLHAGVTRVLAEEVETCGLVVEKTDIVTSKQPANLEFKKGYTTVRVNVREQPFIGAYIHEVYNIGTPVTYAKYNDEWSVVMYGCSEAYIYSEYISDTMPTPTYDLNDLYLLTQLLAGEAIGCDDLTQLYVGSVALNRVKSEYFPDTLQGVIFQKGQYACTWDGNFYKTPTEQCKKNALYLLKYGSILPENVIWQAGFKQGNGIHVEREGVYFCY